METCMKENKKEMLLNASEFQFQALALYVKLGFQCYKVLKFFMIKEHYLRKDLSH